MNKWKNNNMFPVAIVLLFVVIMGMSFGIKYKANDTGDHDIVSDNDAINGNEGDDTDTSNAENSSKVSKYDFIFNKCKKDDKGMYDITDALSGLKLVELQAINDETIVGVDMDLTDTKVLTTVIIFNLTTGELVKSDVNSYERQPYVEYGVEQFKIESINPLVVSDVYGDQACVYWNSLDKANKLECSGQITVVPDIEKKADFYYMDGRNWKVYLYSADEGCKLVYSPDGYWGGYNFVGVQDHKLVMTANDKMTGKHILVTYDTDNNQIDNIYDLTNENVEYGQKMDMAPEGIKLVSTKDEETGVISSIKVGVDNDGDDNNDTDNNDGNANDNKDSNSTDKPQENNSLMDTSFDNLKELSEYQEIRYGRASDIADEIESTYKVNVFLGDNIINATDLYQVKAQTDEQILTQAMTDISQVMSEYPNGMFDEIKDKAYAGINIYVVAEMTNPSATYESGFLADAAGESYSDDEYYNIVVVASGETRRIMSHEIIHMIDQHIANCGEGFVLDTQWESLNPENYMYDSNYVGYNEGNLTKAYVGQYFASTYGMTKIIEDKASILENIQWWDEDSFAQDDMVNAMKTSQYIKGKINVFYEAAKATLECVKEDCDCKWVMALEKYGQ